MDQATVNLIARVNTVQVSADDLLLASDEIHNLPPEDRDWEGRAFVVARLFKGEHLKAFAVQSRLEALMELIRAGSLTAWAPSEADGSHRIAEPVFVAAAKEPILFNDRVAFFEAGSFVTAILRNADSDGNA